MQAEDVQRLSDVGFRPDGGVEEDLLDGGGGGEGERLEDEGGGGVWGGEGDVAHETDGGGERVGWEKKPLAACHGGEGNGGRGD